MEKAFIFVEADNRDAFEAIFAELIYRIVLFPNIDDFVDVNVVRIFLTGNPIPTLLGDTYHSIHHKTKKGGEPFFVVHLSYISGLFLTYPDPGSSGRIHRSSDGLRGSCPLIKGIYIGFFYLNKEESSGLKDRIIHAWHNIHRKGKNRLGRKNCVAFEPYTQWVCARASELKMPYALEKPSFPYAITSSSTIPIENREEFQEILARLKLERDTWECKYHVLNDKKMKMEQHLKEKDDLTEILD
ncbi:uncharacterized protein LOC127079912 [Lathyrus oleraceus]|uniref:uncharacterized protein LOC127079912 n=1 Tax=Pisum sativum TaxID=3888 RepID=UPI0021D22647|nr:uncharacterized protein LOC127079912 [Pisum sativum]